MNENHSDTTSGAPVMMFIAGAVIGAGLALLLAPASGEETRRRIGSTAKRLRDETMNRVGQARDTLSDLKEDAKQAIESGREAFTQGRGPRADSQPAGKTYSESTR